MPEPYGVDRLRAIAAMAVEHGGLDALGELAPREQRRLLKRFRSIGDPGVDKILAFCGLPGGLPLDSNGLRALLRLGYGEEASSYQASYRSAQAAAARELPADADARVRAYLLLREHGRQTCRRSKPRCSSCVLRPRCPFPD